MLTDRQKAQLSARLKRQVAAMEQREKMQHEITDRAGVIRTRVSATVIRRRKTA